LHIFLGDLILKDM